MLGSPFATCEGVIGVVIDIRDSYPQNSEVYDGVTGGVNVRHFDSLRLKLLRGGLGFKLGMELSIEIF